MVSGLGLLLYGLRVSCQVRKIFVGFIPHANAEGVVAVGVLGVKTVDAGRFSLAVVNVYTAA